METIISSIIPMFLIVCIGYAAGYFRMLPRDTGSSLCSFLFNFCCPLIIFVKIVESDISKIFNLPFVFTFLCGQALINLFIILVLKGTLNLSGGKLCARCMEGSYGNLAYIGIPVFVTLFDNVAPVALCTLLHGVFIFPVYIFLMDLDKNPSTRFSVKECLKIIVKNPVILLSLLAVVILYFSIPIPSVILETFRQLGSVSSAVGLFALGFTCNYGGEIRFQWKNMLPAVFTSLVKEIVAPTIAFLVGKYIFHLESFWLTAITIIFMLPSALNVFIVSQRYEVDEEISRLTILFSTFLFSITISLYILLIGI